MSTCNMLPNGTRSGCIRPLRGLLVRAIRRGARHSLRPLAEIPLIRTAGRLQRRAPLLGGILRVRVGVSESILQAPVLIVRRVHRIIPALEYLVLAILPHGQEIRAPNASIQMAAKPTAKATHGHVAVPTTFRGQMQRQLYEKSNNQLWCSRQMMHSTL